MFGFFILALLFSVLAVSCEPGRDSFGVGLVPESERLEVRCDTIGGVGIWSAPEAAGTYSAFTKAALGEIEDEQFGTVRSLVVGELFPSSRLTTGYSVATQLGVYLTFTFVESYGSGDLVLEFYELSRRLPDSAIRGEEADWEVGVKYGEVTLKGNEAKVTLRLPDELGKRLMEALERNREKLSGWSEDYYGIKIVARRADPSDKGRMVLLHTSSPEDGIMVKWQHEGRESNVRFQFGRAGRRYYYTRYDPSGLPLQAQLAVDKEGQQSSSSFYLTGDRGVTTFLDFGEVVRRWRDSMPMVLHRVELCVPMAEASVALGDSLVGRLVAVTFDEDGRRFELPDQTVSGSVYGGYYLRQRGYYSINMTLFFQQLLRDEGGRPVVELRAADFVPGVGRVILSREGLPRSPGLSLIITYTPLH